MHASEPLIYELNSFEVEITIENLRIYELSGIDQILAELIQGGGNTLHCESTNLLILFGIRRIAATVGGVYNFTYL
jgi:hypothetical protein